MICFEIKKSSERNPHPDPPPLPHRPHFFPPLFIVDPLKVSWSSFTTSSYIILRRPGRLLTHKRNKSERHKKKKDIKNRGYEVGDRGLLLPDSPIKRDTILFFFFRAFRKEEESKARSLLSDPEKQLVAVKLCWDQVRLIWWLSSKDKRRLIASLLIRIAIVGKVIFCYTLPLYETNKMPLVVLHFSVVWSPVIRFESWKPLHPKYPY